MSAFAALFLTVLCTGLLVRFWLSARQIRAVVSHRDRVPAPFEASIDGAEHRKAADYTVATVRLGRYSALIDFAVTVALTVGGGVAALDSLWQRTGWSDPWRGAAVIATVAALAALADLPLSAWKTFRLEAAFGFNRITPALFIQDLLKSTLLSVLIGGPVVLAALELMRHAGSTWWIWAWAGWTGLMLLMTWAWPALIAPLFNRFAPLQDAVLRDRIDSLLGRCGFASKGVFVVDGSRRSAHGNAYFTGIGRNKRIVFFDTLLASLSHPEIEAVLAHELGHFKLKHVRNRLLITMILSFGALALLGWLARQPWLYSSFGVATASNHTALLLFMLIAPAFAFFTTPIGAFRSRRHEFEADAFASEQAQAADLISALVKLYRDNASTLTPDRVYSRFYYSHPPALERISHLTKAGSVSAVRPQPAAAG